jgi:uncharacterized protein (DUF608 family)
MTFAALHCQDGGKLDCFRVLEGQVPASRIYDQGRAGSGLLRSGHEGLPRMTDNEFRGEFPFAWVKLKDAAMPIDVTIEAWSPLIPGDANASGLPAAFVTYRLRNRLRRPLKLQFSFNVQYPIPNRGEKPTVIHSNRGRVKGLRFTSGLETDHLDYGTVAVTSRKSGQLANCAWFRGGWFDSLTILSNQLQQGLLSRSAQQEDGPGGSPRFGATLFWNIELAANEAVEIPLTYSWHMPNSELSYGKVADQDCCATENHQAFYTTQFADAWEVAVHADKFGNSLKTRSEKFHASLFSTTLPDYVIDAVSANLAILKSPTVLRQADGSLWCWEGCSAGAGCCPGSCTHVWNYAQAIAHLFPGLERTLRDQEFIWSMNDEGHVAHRAALPTGPIGHDFHSAADGQLGGLLKLYRDWQISGDTEWMAERYPLARKSLEYCIQTWDPDQRGALIEPHHNTYDIEFWGADIMCTGFYLGALQAMAAMATELGLQEDASHFLKLAGQGRQLVDKLLWNGEYYHQSGDWNKVQAAARIDQWVGAEGRLNDGAYSSEALKLLQKEGPKYQYGTGCLSDGVIGQWFTTQLRLADALPRARTRKHLKAIYKHNFKQSLRDHVNPQRPGYAMGDEVGLLLCTWPRGGKPNLPFVYSNEVWTGIEYQVASHMIYEDMVDEGLSIVEGLRRRYDGTVRNPWNEYECGNYYARALASYALLTALTGFHYSAVNKCLTIAPKLANKGRFFFSTDKAWGCVHFDLVGNTLKVQVEEGCLRVASIVVEQAVQQQQVIEYCPAIDVEEGSSRKFSLKST